MKIPLPLHLLLFFSLIHFSNGCLKINILPPTTTLAPNTCHCEALPLNSTTIQAYIQPSNPFYLVLSTATLSAPTVSFDECSVMMWCDGDYSLVVFDDTSLGKIFGAYPANGFCDAESQEWLVDTREGLGLTRFNQLYGICFIAPTTPSTTSSTVTTPSTPSTTRSSTTVSSTVTTPRPTTTTPAPTSTTNPSTTRLSSSTTVSSTVTTPTTPSTTSPSTTTSTTVTSTTLICDCEYVALDRFTIRNYISSDNLFYNDLTSENVVLPIATNESCSVTMTCPTGYSMLVFDRTNLGKLFPGTFASGDCEIIHVDVGKKWKVDVGSTRIKFDQFYGTCIASESENTHNVSTSTTHTTTTNSECTPTSRSTFVYAYSNDKFANEFHRIWPPRNQSRDFSDRMYSMYATIRFDTVAEDEIQYHTTWEDLTTSSVHLPDRSLGFNNSDAGSDVLKMIEKFLDNTQSPVCNSVIIIHFFRYPNEVDIDQLVEKIRYHHVTLYMFMDNNPYIVLGRSPQTLHNLATRTNGMVIINISVAQIEPTYLFYAANPKVSGRGTIELPRLQVPVGNYTMRVTVQDHLPLDMFHNFTISGNGIHPSPIRITAIQSLDDYADILIWNRNYAAIRIAVVSNNSNLFLQYDYSTEGTQVMHIRVVGSTTTPYSWPVYSD